MHELDLDTAVREILQACKTTKSGRPPFFFIVGAGISSPPVPTATEIETECRKIATGRSLKREPESSLPIVTYSHWFQQAFSDRQQRRDYLESLIRNKPISLANLRLAQLLLEKSAVSLVPAASLVVTPNFDDFLSRALTLFGRQQIVCDHPNTAERINPESDEIQIVHVHGTYWFYDCCNLRGELKERAYIPGAQTVTMGSLLDGVLEHRSPLVVGYKGWDEDVIMAALKRRLVSPQGGPRGLGRNLYWFGYRRSTVDSLPDDWLRNHPDVRFVLPPEQRKEEAGRSGTTVQIGLEQASGPRGEEPTLSAQSVFERLIKAFELDAPALTRDPVKFFAEHLRRSFPEDRGESSPFSFGAVIQQVEDARTCLEQRIPASRESRFNLQLEKVRDALRRSASAEAIKTAQAVDITEGNRKQLEGLMKLVLTAALGLNDNSETELAGYDLVVQIADGLAREGRLEVPSSETVAKALVNKGFTLGQLKRSEEGVAVYEEVVRRFGEAGEPALREQVAMALVNKGFTLRQLNRVEEAVEAYETAVRRFGEAREPALRRQVAKALFNKGFALQKLGRPEEALANYEEVVRRLGEAREPALREQVVMALVNKGDALLQLNRSQEALAASEEAVRRFDEAREPTLRNQVAMALVNKGDALGQLSRREEAVAAYEEVVRRFGEAREPALREPVATALVNKGQALGQLKRSEEALAAYDEVVRRFGEAREPAVREQVAKAMVNKGVALGWLNRSEEQIAAYEEVVRRFGEAAEPALREVVEEAKQKLQELRGLTS